MNVRPKKHLGQHFLLDLSICERISNALCGHGNYSTIVEIGPGTGALTQFLLQRDEQIEVVEIDQESVAFLKLNFPQLHGKIHSEDFLQMNLTHSFGTNFAVAGNFPYNISSQILFQVLDYWEYVPELVGMFQKEVAMRVASGPGNKDYGILSVLLQVHYDIEYLFTVDEHVFNPPPKVKSGVIHMKRKEKPLLQSGQKEFKQVVKLAFNQRRKTLRNSVKSICSQNIDSSLPIFQKRPEQLGVAEFMELTQLLFPHLTIQP
ncbi:MAG: 16S rRNA (adenine(1518)-N(6)/adenine(1519)-N(6))-dimethyltransferase RsmA [Bacteroidota bacterium]